VVVSKSEGLGERAALWLEPVPRVKLYFFYLPEFGEFEGLVLERVVEHPARYFDIFEAIVADFLLESFAPPLERVESVAAFVRFKSAFSDGIELYAAAEHPVYLFEDVDAFYALQIARIILVEKRNIEMVGIVADQRIGVLEHFPESGEFVRIECGERFGLRIMDADDRYIERCRIRRPHVRELIRCFYVKRDDAHLGSVAY